VSAMNDDPRANLAALLSALSEALSTIEAEQRKPTPPPPNEATAEGPALISIPEAARILGLKRASAYRYAAAGILPVKRFGRRVYVVRARLADVTIPDSTTSWEGEAA
jgi:hypothetical protein